MVVGELVQHEEHWVLRQRPCVQHALAFAAGGGGVVAVREGPYAAAVDGVRQGSVILGSVTAEQPVVRCAAEGHDLGDGPAGGVAAGVLKDGRCTARRGARLV